VCVKVVVTFLSQSKSVLVCMCVCERVRE